MTNLIHAPGNERQIDELFAFMSIDDEGRNGVLASVLPGIGATPLVTGSPIVVDILKPLAEQIARQTGKRVGLFRFKRDAQIWEMTP